MHERDGRTYHDAVRAVRPTVALVLLLAGCTAGGGTDPAPPSAAPQTPAIAASCGSPVSTGAMPEWARTRAGFGADAGIPWVAGERGDIVGVLFGHPLSAPPAVDRSNKILWISRPDVAMGDTLVITARQDGAAGPVRREVAGGPGPSIIDMPGPGCWHFDLGWSRHTDAVELTYRPGPSGVPS
jgi:hypothetical protein